MINKALFKQSCKANWVKWLSVTIATCTMLAIVIIVLGNLGINDIRDSLKDVFTQADQEAVLKENSVDSYDLYLTSVDGSNQIVVGIGQMFDSYDKAKEEYTELTGSAPTGDDLTLIQTQIVDGMLAEFGSLIANSGMTEEQFKTTIISFLNSYDSNPVVESFLISTVKSQMLPQMLPAQIGAMAKEQKLIGNVKHKKHTEN